MKKLVTLLVVVLLLPSAVTAGPITSIFVFGDSFSDGGNAAVISGNIVPPSPPYAQRFSNGPVAVEYLASQLGISLTASLGPSGGTNYAVGGAATTQVAIPGGGGATTNNFETINPAVPDSVKPLFAGRGIDAQVGAFVAAPPVFDPASALFVVWGGMNDLFISADAVTAANAVNALAAHIQMLYGVGAQNFLVPNMVDLSLAPFALARPPAEQADLLALSVGFNSGLAIALNSLGVLPGINITPFDTFAFNRAAVANPAAFGFTNVTGSCLDAVVGPCASPDEYLYWDGVHLTTRAHELLANDLRQAIAEPAVPEPAILILVAAGLAGAVWRRALR